MKPTLHPVPADHKEYGDLRKDSEEYRAHREAILVISAEAKQFADLVKEAIAQTERRIAGIPIHSSQLAPDRNLPRMEAIDKEQHVNCYGLQFLFHSVGLESFRRENDNQRIADLRPLLERIASTRMSIANFALTKQPIDHTDTIKGIDARLKDLIGTEVEVPSLVPYYFTPQSTMTELGKKVGNRKFSDPDLLMDLGVLFASDGHVLHSICMALATNGMPKDIELVLMSRAEVEFPQFRQHALTPLLQSHPDLFVAHIIGLVESGQTEKALQWCQKQHFKELLIQRPELALKYVAALRHQGRLREAMDFCITNKNNPALQDRKFGQEFKMASVGYRGVFPLTIEEFKKRYPNS